ncbi:Cupredoxin [Radiomyces spectabilis]|uniref:Cupredoxin n=1 Tax=Radiomyces spectabilis TaxID=64574 RepID=UPI002220DFFD|nr:Cupredoxin [Radiomyces spectabilis]KAI8368179.1 Cupredoxin [Radiomyces spectabilis]
MREKCIILLLLLCTLVSAKVRKFELNVSRASVNPDCSTSVDKLVVNGQFPGPPIRVKKNDHVHIIVRNHVHNETTTMHFHGINQIGSLEADGMPNVTQAPIQPGHEYHHEFQVIGQSGTYFYHAHVGLQEDTIQGPFIVYDDDDSWPEESNHHHHHDNHHHTLKDGPYKYDDERVLMLSEWWQQTAEARVAYVMGDNYKGSVPADSYLINGRTIHNTSTAHGSCKKYSAIDVLPDKTYRLRVIGGLSFSTLGISIARHTMTVIEVDGNLVKPYETNYLQVTSGQRFSVLVKTDQAHESYFIGTKPYYSQASSSNGVAIFRYVKHASSVDRQLGDRMFDAVAKNATVLDQPTFPASTSQWIFPYLQPVKRSHLDFNKPPDRTIIITPVEKKMKDNTTRWLINDHLAPHWKTPLINQLKAGTRPAFNMTAVALNMENKGDGYDDHLQTYPILHDEIVDFVIHTTTLGPGACIGHPWHTHGHPHYTIAHGPGAYDHKRDASIRSYPTPIERDTSFIFPDDSRLTMGQGGGVPCGWTKLRFHATNPGLWAFHCHITSHMLQGMMTVLEVATDRHHNAHQHHQH